MDPTLTDHGDPPVRVTCGYVDENLTAYITELTLGQNNLVGAIPASIGNLSSKLSTLGIFYNPGPSARPNRVLVCVVRTLNPIGQARVTLSPRYEQLRAVHGPRQEEKGPGICPKRRRTGAMVLTRMPKRERSRAIGRVMPCEHRHEEMEGEGEHDPGRGR